MKHTINIFLEQFNECQIFSEDLNEIIFAPVQKLNWRILPPGPMPFAQLLQELAPLIELVAGSKRPFLIHRFRTINEYGPTDCYQGTAGFTGYIIFAFPEKNLYVCDNAYYGNATYLFDEDWEELSRKTKAEILSDELHIERIIHRADAWEDRIHQLLA